MFIDSHLHFNNEKYKEAGMVVSEMINRAKILGVEKFITISTKTREFEEITQISEEFPEVYHSLGIYPTEDFGMKLNDLENLIINHINKKTVAIGECGFNQPLEENDRNIKSQRSLFEMQLDLATRRNLPIVIHNRNSDVETLEVLNEFKNKTFSSLGFLPLPQGIIIDFMHILIIVSVINGISIPLLYLSKHHNLNNKLVLVVI